MLNGILYIGLGQYNTAHPYSLIPVTISGNTAVAGNPITMPAAGYSDLASCTPGSPLATGENKVGSGIRIYPNPATDQIHIEYPELSTMPAALRIYNSLGTVILEKTAVKKNETIDIYGFAPGIYYLMIDKYCQKIVKQ